MPATSLGLQPCSVMVCLLCGMKALRGGPLPSSEQRCVCISACAAWVWYWVGRMWGTGTQTCRVGWAFLLFDCSRLRFVDPTTEKVASSSLDPLEFMALSPALAVLVPIQSGSCNCCLPHSGVHLGHVLPAVNFSVCCCGSAAKHCACAALCRCLHIRRCGPCMLIAEAEKCPLA